MALKDWKMRKIKDGVIFQNEFIEYVTIFYSKIPSIKNRWIIETKDKIKYFKTKPLALAYARAYMKTH